MNAPKIKILIIKNELYDKRISRFVLKRLETFVTSSLYHKILEDTEFARLENLHLNHVTNFYSFKKIERMFNFSNMPKLKEIKIKKNMSLDNMFFSFSTLEYIKFLFPGFNMIMFADFFCLQLNETTKRFEECNICYKDVVVNKLFKPMCCSFESLQVCETCVLKSETCCICNQEQFVYKGRNEKIYILDLVHRRLVTFEL